MKPASAQWSPQLGLIISAPDVLFGSRKMRDLHLDITQASIHELLVWYWKRKIPGHFLTSARTKYAYMNRQPKYKRTKLRVMKSRTDLVYSRKTSALMVRQSPKITFPKKGRADLTLKGMATLARLPFPTSRRPKATIHVTPDVMAQEITRWSSDEVTEAANRFTAGFAKRLKVALLTRPRWRKQLAAAGTFP